MKVEVTCPVFRLDIHSIGLLSDVERTPRRTGTHAIMTSVAETLSLTESFRISFATYDHDGKVSPSLSISKSEAAKLTKATKDEDIGHAPLSCFWNRIGKNSFCLPDGGVLRGTTSLSDYYAAAKDHYPENLAALTKRSPPTYTVCYKEKTRVPNDKKAGDTKLDLTLHTFETPNREWKALPTAKGVDENAIADDGQEDATRPARMSARDWNEVLVVNSLLNGFVVDETRGTVERARKTAFRLVPNPVHPLKFSPGSVSAAELASIKDRARAAVADKAPPINRVEDSLKPAFVNGGQQHMGGAFAPQDHHGVDPTLPPPARIEQSGGKPAPTPVDVKVEQKVEKKDEKKVDSKPEPKPADPEVDKKTDDEKVETKPADPKAEKKVEKTTEKDDGKPKAKKKNDDDDEEGAADDPVDHLFPLWETCDDSKIRIETISTMLQQSSAEQGFSAKSLEIAAELSTTKLAGGLSYGSASSDKSSKERESGSTHEQMHATYEFPRVRLYLDNESIVLSDDCKAAIEKIRDQRNYHDLVEFYNHYGTLFVTRVKLGGRLRATKLIDGSMAAARDSSENAWKTSIAASLSNPVFSASYDSKKEGASATDTQSQSTAMVESVCWEAHGGNTLLANNPGKWCGTVEPFWFWRVVEQEIVLPIEHVISSLHGFGWVRRVFSDLYVDASFPSPGTVIMWNGAGGGKVNVGQGLGSSGIEKEEDLLRKSLVNVGEPLVNPLSDAMKTKWTVITDNSGLHKYLAETFDETVNPWVKTKLFPNHVFGLRVSDRAFSVVLHLYHPVERVNLKPGYSWNKETPTDSASCQRVYGDRFVTATISGFSLTVRWSFDPALPSPDQFRTKKEVVNFFANADPSMHFSVGCTFLSKVAGLIDGSSSVALYDPYYKRISQPSLTAVMPAIEKRMQQFPKQVLRVHIGSYVDWLGAAQLPKTVSQPPKYPLWTIKALRSDFVSYVLQAIKRSGNATGILSGFQFPGKLNIAGADFQYATPLDKLNILPGRIDVNDKSDVNSETVEFVPDSSEPPPLKKRHPKALVDGVLVSWHTEFALNRLVAAIKANKSDEDKSDFRVRFGPADYLSDSIDAVWTMGDSVYVGGISPLWGSLYGDAFYFERLLRLIRMGRRDEAQKLALQP